MKSAKYSALTKMLQAVAMNVRAASITWKWLYPSASAPPCPHHVPTSTWHILAYGLLINQLPVSPVLRGRAERPAAIYTVPNPSPRQTKQQTLPEPAVSKMSLKVVMVSLGGPLRQPARLIEKKKSSGRIQEQEAQQQEPEVRENSLTGLQLRSSSKTGCISTKMSHPP